MKKTAMALMIGLAAAAAWAQGDKPAKPRDVGGRPAASEATRGADDPFTDGRREGRRRGSSSDGRRQFSEEELADAVEVLREFKPEIAARIDEVAQKNPEQVGRMIGSAMPHVRELMWTKRNDPELFALQARDYRADREADALAARYREAVRKQDPAAAALRDELRAKVAEHFGIRQQVREHRLARFERRIREFREQIQEMQDNKEELIDDRIKKLTDADEKPEW